MNKDNPPETPAGYVMAREFAEAIYGSFARDDSGPEGHEYSCVHCEVPVNIDAWTKTAHTPECIVNKAKAMLSAPDRQKDGIQEELIEARATIERLLDSEQDKIMAMSEDQINAALRLEGRDPEDVARLGKQAAKLALLTVEKESVERDCLTLALRLYGENENTFAPNTREVMSRWRPKCQALLSGEIDEKW